ncbi:MAG: hypothetical protein SGI77_03835 [Pirellulaceae bacterium]|nr:hypothetical protein [Pirellulaceae bacterium]
MSELTPDKPIRTRQIVFDVFVLLLPLFGLLPMLLLQTLQLWGKPYAKFLPFAWLFLAILVAIAPKSMTTSRWRIGFSIVCLLLAVLVGTVAVVDFSPWTANFALALVFISWGMVRLASDSHFRVLALSMLILVTLPLPLGFDQYLTSKGDSLVIYLLSPVLDAINIYHLYRAPTIMLKDHNFDVSVLLSTPMSVQAMLAFSIAISLLWKRPFLTTTCSALSACLWAMLAKAFFLLTTALFSYYEINITQSYLGTVVLLIIALIAILLVVASDAFWSAVLTPIRVGDENAIYRSNTANVFNQLVVLPVRLFAEDVSGRPPMTSPDLPRAEYPKWIGLAAGIVMGALMLPSLFAIVRNDLIFNRANYFAISKDRLPVASTLSDDFLNRQRQRQFRSNLGDGISQSIAKTFTWHYSGSGMDSIIVLKMPVRGWHSPNYLIDSGWDVQDTVIKNDASQWAWSETTGSSEGGFSLLVLSTQMHTNGTSYDPTEDELQVTSKTPEVTSGWFSFRILDLLNPKQETLKPQTICIQMRYQSDSRLRDVEKNEVLKDFFAVRKLLTDRILAKPAEPIP